MEAGSWDFTSHLDVCASGLTLGREMDVDGNGGVRMGSFTVSLSFQPPFLANRNSHARTFSPLLRRILARPLPRRLLILVPVWIECQTSSAAAEVRGSASMRVSPFLSLSVQGILVSSCREYANVQRTHTGMYDLRQERRIVGVQVDDVVVGAGRVRPVLVSLQDVRNFRHERIVRVWIGEQRADAQ